MTGSSTVRVAAISHDQAMRLAATEYQRFLDLLRSLEPEDWTKPTDCPVGMSGLWPRTCSAWSKWPRRYGKTYAK